MSLTEVFLPLLKYYKHCHLQYAFNSRIPEDDGLLSVHYITVYYNI